MKFKTFKKAKLAFAVAAAMGTATLSNPAQAVNIAADGLGEALLFPYYTVRDGWDTYLNITNTSGHAVAFKIRFRESLNSRDARDFNVVLSPYDVWTASVTLVNGVPQLQTRDNSCTAPALADAGNYKYVNFTNLAYDGNGSQPADEGPTSIDRTYEGHFEVIEMGHSPYVAGTPVDNAADSVAVNAEHDSNGVPADCSAVVAAFENDLAGVRAEFDEPINVLKGAATLIKVAEGKAVGYDPTVLANFFNPALSGIDGASGTDLIAQPRDLDPNLSSGSTTSVLMDDSVGVGHDGLAANHVITDSWTYGVDAVSAVLTRNTVVNQYSVNPNTGASSDWVVTFPTKNYYADTYEVNRVTGGAGPRAPFAELFQDDDGSVAGKSCMEVNLKAYDREEQTLTTVISGFSPQPADAPGTNLCYETNVITFDGSYVLGGDSNVVNHLNVGGTDLPGNNGWVNLRFTTTNSTPILSDTQTATNSYQGLPVIGFAVKSLNNDTEAGNNRNYASAWDHSYTRMISGS